MDHSERDKRFYVYLHLDNLGRIRYIGSGTADRYKVKVDRSKEHLELWDSLDKIKIKENLSSSTAKDLEQYLINDFKESVFLLNKKLNVCKTKEYKCEYFEKYLEYSEDSPSGLVWKISPNANIKAGEVAGTLGNKGYWSVGIRGSYYRNHRVIYTLCTKTNLPQNLIIDHIDGDKSNNKIVNLRLTTHIGNSLNKGKRVDNKTNVAGVRWCRTLNKWYATWVEDLKPKSKSFSPKTLYPDLPPEEAKERAFEDAVAFRKQIEENLYKPINKMLEELYNSSKSVLGL